MHSHQSSPHLLPVGAWDSVGVKDFPYSDLQGQVPCKAFLVRWGVVNAFLFFLKNCLEPPWQVHICRGLGSSGLRPPLLWVPRRAWPSWSPGLHKRWLLWGGLVASVFAL